MHIDAPQRRKHSISLTPLIDVVFILLLFFMLATNFTDWREITLATGTTASEAKQPPPALVHVSADGTLRYDGANRSVEELSQLLKAQKAKSKISAVVLQPAPATTLGPTVTALEALAATGLPVALGQGAATRTKAGAGATP